METLLNDFSPGLFVMQTVIFVIILFVLVKFAWGPILNSLRVREESIKDALNAAQLAKEEMAQIKADNEYLLQEARAERDRMLKDAIDIANKIKEDAKNETASIAEKMIADAKISIQSEKKAALAEVKSLVAELSLEIAEKVIREKLSTDKSQKDLIDKFLKEVKVN
jgi:F-type H+-transporting ATPase subunit b